MKTILFLIVLTSTALANPLSTLESAGIMGNLDFNLCDPRANAAPYCRNLYDYACQQVKSNHRRDSLERRLNTAYWDSLPQNTSYNTFSETSRNALQAAEDSVYELTHVTRDSIRLALTDAKTNLMQVISDRTGERWLSPLPLNPTRRAMAQKIQNMGLRYGREYVEDLVRHSKAQQPNVSESVHRANAYNQYHAQCGGNGLERNAFSTDDYIVLCPGLIISMADYRSDKDQIIKSLAFTFGHELGHAIDASKPEYAPGYANMKQCYEQQTRNNGIWSPVIAADTSADFWGTYVLAQRLKTISDPEERARTVALSLDGFCEETANPMHRSAGLLRVHQMIGRNPILAETLGCAGAGRDRNAPFCSMEGLVPRP